MPQIEDWLTWDKSGTRYKLQSWNWLDPDEAQGRHHIYVDVRDKAGNRLAGTPIHQTWGGGQAEGVVEEKPGEPFGGNFSMNAGLGAYGLWVGNDRAKSDYIFGMGLGTPDEPSVSHHTCFELVFVDNGPGGVPTPPEEPEEPEEPEQPEEPEPPPDPPEEPDPPESPDLAALRAKIVEAMDALVEALAMVDALL